MPMISTNRNDEERGATARGAQERGSETHRTFSVQGRGSAWGGQVPGHDSTSKDGDSRARSCSLCVVQPKVAGDMPIPKVTGSRRKPPNHRFPYPPRSDALCKRASVGIARKGASESVGAQGPRGLAP